MTPSPPIGLTKQENPAYPRRHATHRHSFRTDRQHPLVARAFPRGAMARLVIFTR